MRASTEEAPARATLQRLEPGGCWHGVSASRIELISRGDIVNGILARVPTSGGGQTGHGGSALLLVTHDAGGSASSRDLAPIAGWVSDGLAVVAIDLPLHGHRASAKLSERLAASIAKHDRGEPLDPDGAVLFEEFHRQATIDLIRTLDAVLALREFDSKRVGLLGIGLGARLATTLLACDDRFGSTVLVHTARVAVPPAAGVVATSPARPEAATLALEFASGAWPADARAYLASRLGF